MIGSGVYQIVNKVNGKTYIGSTVNLKQRKYKHFYALRKNEHDNRHIQNAYNLYGEKSFVFEVIQHTSDTGRLIEIEQYYLDTLKPEYNISPTAANCLGVKHTLETRQKMTESHLQRYKDPEVRRQLSESHLRRYQDPIERNKTSKASKKMWENPERRKRQSEIHIKRYKCPEERKKTSDTIKEYYKNNPTAGNQFGEKRKGEKNGRAVLTESDVIEVKALLRQGKLSLKKIAILYGVGKSTVNHIKNGNTWKHINA